MCCPYVHTHVEFVLWLSPEGEEVWFQGFISQVGDLKDVDGWLLITHFLGVMDGWVS
jgi:hypothetical protein